MGRAGEGAERNLTVNLSASGPPDVSTVKALVLVKCHTVVFGSHHPEVTVIRTLLTRRRTPRASPDPIPACSGGATTDRRNGVTA
ncbi:hypothetical protein GCM10009828_103900 [Actinoplanes couchii]|uniref:Uncharacterized protein n=1 Tax=Actinoplanes couchii TaxID=403638 RepID=A0ABQ3XLC0_9ACTN|nr:hypothetical protein Aco03nite_077160 [Actinoplanes couchii]